MLFLSNQVVLGEQLIKGQLDWITCWSSQLPKLRGALKEHLGVTILPKGPMGQPSPITRLQVWALGRNSSRRQRSDSLKLLGFMVEPWTQKTLALNYRTSFPVNPQVAPIVQRQLAFEQNVTGPHLELGLSDKPSTRHANAVLAAMSTNPQRMADVNGVLSSVVFGTRTPKQATSALQNTLRGEQP